MKSKWVTRPLGELVQFTSGGTPSKKKTDYWIGNIPWISAKTLKSERISTSDLFISEDGLNAGSKLAPRGSILLLIRGCGLFNGIPVGLVEREVAFNQDIKCLDSCSEVENKFIFYWLISQQKYLMAKVGVTGIGAGKFDLDFLQKLKVPVPSEQERTKIIAIGDALSDKIELNRKINENLERQAQAIFQLWFTDKKEANGCLAGICQYSKEKVTVSSLDLESYYSTENMLPGKAGATQAANLPTTAQTTKCNVGDILVSNIRPYFKKIVYCHADCGCSTDVLCFAPKKQELSAYLFFLLYADSFFDFMVAGSKGTKMPRGDKQQIMMYPVYVPSDEELAGFNDIAQPMLKQIQLNREENKRLIALRDTLLPKLMAGEVKIFQSQNILSNMMGT